VVCVKCEYVRLCIVGEFVCTCVYLVEVDLCACKI